MTVSLIPKDCLKDTVYTATSLDTKPSPASTAAGVARVGNTYLYETDTGDMYYYDGANWIKKYEDGKTLVQASFPEPVHDAFGRIRTSNPETIFDSKQLYDNQPLFWDESSTGSGSTGTHSTDTASVVLDVDSTTAGSTTRQTFMRFNYQPGKSQLIMMTGTLKPTGTSGAGLVRGWGYGDDDNGLFLVDDEGTINLRKRTYTSGAAVDTDVAQANWNIDVMDGSGPSGITLDWTKSQILFIDFEWLGVGRVRIGFVVDGAIYYVHQFVHANSLAGVYMSTPNLPLRYWIDNDGTYASAATLEHICCSVISEGGAQDTGVLRYASTSNVQVNCAAVGLMYLVKGIRLKSASIGATIKIISSALQIQSTGDDIEWQLIFNPTYSAGPTWNNETNSAVQTCTGTGQNVILGYPITGGYLASGTGGSASGSMEKDIENALLLGSDISGTVQTIALCAKALTNVNTLVEGSITWRELL